MGGACIAAPPSVGFGAAWWTHHSPSVCAWLEVKFADNDRQPQNEEGKDCQGFLGTGFHFSTTPG